MAHRQLALNRDIRIGVFPEGEEIFVFCQRPNAGGLFFET
jgi:hypothetical protein